MSGVPADLKAVQPAAGVLGAITPDKAPEEKKVDPVAPLFKVLTKLAALRREAIDTVALRAVLAEAPDPTVPEILEDLARHFGLKSPKWSRHADPARAPVIMHHDGSWVLVAGQRPEGDWILAEVNPETGQFAERLAETLPKDARFAQLRLVAPFSIGRSPTLQTISAEIFAEKRILLEILAASLAVAVLALAVSFFSMQVYDRVIPTQAYSTLLVLTIGVLVAIALELLGKWSRAGFLHYLTDAVDQRLAKTAYTRLLGIRMDQLPPSVGSAAQRVRGYESVRSFLVGLSTHVLVDLPMSLLLLSVLFAIGGLLSLIPLTFFIIGLIVGLVLKRRIETWAKHATAAQMRKTGLLVEAIEGAEIIKSGNGGWRLMSRWLDVTDEAREYDIKMRNLRERAQFLLSGMQQGAYVLIIALGAVMTGDGSLTMGGLLACSILAGRVMTPLGAVPQQLMQWADTKAAVEALDQMWTLAQDVGDGDQPILLENIKGEYELSDVSFVYSGTEHPALQVEKLSIAPGERVAIIGAIGSGKTTLLRALSGMYRPTEGRVLLDGVEIGAISKSMLSAQMGFVPQDGRLFSGTLRENLILGMEDPGDAELLAVAKNTGLYQTVIAPHPKGLERQISEGGSGLSGGQRQLVHITRAFLRKPRVWLLDEPTASMDQKQELHVLQALRKEIIGSDRPTTIIVTHKPQVLQLVDRVIVVANHRILMDGPRSKILRNRRPASAESKAPTDTAPSQAKAST